MRVSSYLLKSRSIAPFSLVFWCICSILSQLLLYQRIFFCMYVCIALHCIGLVSLCANENWVHFVVVVIVVGDGKTNGKPKCTSNWIAPNNSKWRHCTRCFPVFHLLLRSHVIRIYVCRFACYFLRLFCLLLRMPSSDGFESVAKRIMYNAHRHWHWHWHITVIWWFRPL